MIVVQSEGAWRQHEAWRREGWLGWERRDPDPLEDRFIAAVKLLQEDSVRVREAIYGTLELYRLKLQYSFNS